MPEINRIYVSGLRPDITDSDIRECFGVFGIISWVCVMHQQGTYCEVQFDSRADIDSALAAHMRWKCLGDNVTVRRSTGARSENAKRSRKSRRCMVREKSRPIFGGMSAAMSASAIAGMLAESISPSVDSDNERALETHEAAALETQIEDPSPHVRLLMCLGDDNLDTLSVAVSTDGCGSDGTAFPHGSASSMSEAELPELSDDEDADVLRFLAGRARTDSAEVNGASPKSSQTGAQRVRRRLPVLLDTPASPNPSERMRSKYDMRRSEKSRGHDEKRRKVDSGECSPAQPKCQRSLSFGSDTWREESDEGCLLCLENIPEDMDRIELSELGREYSKAVSYARVYKTRGKTFGLLGFMVDCEARRVMEALQGRKIEGCQMPLQINVNL